MLLFQQNVLQSMLSAEQKFCKMKVGMPTVHAYVCTSLSAFSVQVPFCAFVIVELVAEKCNHVTSSMAYVCMAILLCLQCFGNAIMPYNTYVLHIEKLW